METIDLVPSYTREIRKCVLWVELHPPKRYIEILIPGTCECDLISR